MLHLSRKQKSIATFTTALLLIASYFLSLFFYNSHQWIAAWLSENAHVSIFLSKDFSNSSYQKLYSTVGDNYRIINIREVSPRQAVVEIQEQLQIDLNLFDTPYSNIFPSTIEFDVRPNYYHEIPQIIESLRGIEGISDIAYPGTEFEVIVIFQESFRFLASGIAILLGTIIVFLLASMIKSSLQQQTAELQLLLRFGAPLTSIYLPFSLEVGMVLGGSVVLSYSILLLWMSTGSPFFNLNVLFPNFKDSIALLTWEYFPVGASSIFIAGECCAYWLLRSQYTRFAMR